MSTIAATVLINAQTADDNSQPPRLLYQPPTNGRTIIDKFTATNTDSGLQTLTVYLVPSGGSAGATNVIIKEKSISPTDTYDFSELQNQILKNGDSISAVASVANAIVIRASGREIT